MLLLFLTLLPLLVFSQETTHYVPGRGLKIKPIKSTVGGYVTVSYEKSGLHESFELDDLALLIYGHPLERLKYFLELELDNLYSVKNGKKRFKKRIDIERGYVEFILSEAFKLRVGRFITPVGLWNPIHINVLKWTTSDPLTATEFFPKFTTGLEVFGNLPSDFSYSLFAQNNRGISEGYNNFLTRKVIGGELRKELSENLRIGLNGGWFEIKEPKEELTFFGANILYKTIGLELSAELMYAIEKEKYLPETRWSYRLSYYAQGVYRVFRGNYAVVRFGTFKDKSDSKHYRILTLGWNFRPVYYTAFKVEYQLRRKKELSTFLTSFSWMF